MGFALRTSLLAVCCLTSLTTAESGNSDVTIKGSNNGNSNSVSKINSDNKNGESYRPEYWGGGHRYPQNWHWLDPQVPPPSGRGTGGNSNVKIDGSNNANVNSESKVNSDNNNGGNYPPRLNFWRGRYAPFQWNPPNWHAPLSVPYQRPFYPSASSNKNINIEGSNNANSNSESKINSDNNYVKSKREQPEDVVGEELIETDPQQLLLEESSNDNNYEQLDGAPVNVKRQVYSETKTKTKIKADGTVKTKTKTATRLGLGLPSFLSKRQQSDEVVSDEVVEIETDPQLLLVEEASDEDLADGVDEGRKFICVDTHCGVWPDNMAVVLTDDDQIVGVISEDNVGGDLLIVPEESDLDLETRDVDEPLLETEDSTTMPPVQSTTLPTTGQTTLPPLARGRMSPGKGAGFRSAKPWLNPLKNGRGKSNSTEQKEKVRKLKATIRGELQKLKEVEAKIETLRAQYKQVGSFANSNWSKTGKTTSRQKNNNRDNASKYDGGEETRKNTSSKSRPKTTKSDGAVAQQVPA